MLFNVCGINIFLVEVVPIETVYSKGGVGVARRHLPSPPYMSPIGSSLTRSLTLEKFILQAKFGLFSPIWANMAHICYII